MRASTFFALVIALLIGFAAFAGVRYSGWLEPTVVKEAPKAEEKKILASKKNLFAGYVMTQFDVEARYPGKEEKKEYDLHPEKFVTPYPGAVNARIINRNLEANVPILKEYLEPIVLPEGIGLRLTPKMRAVHLTLPSDRAAGGVIRPGEYVDVLLTSNITGKKGTEISRTARIDRELRVLLKQDQLWPTLYALAPDKAIRFTLEADPYRSALIEFAKDHGLITLVPTPTLPLPKDAKIEPPTSFSDPASKEYKNEDQRVGAILRGDRGVGEPDLERIFGLPPIPVEQIVRVETLVGNKAQGVSQFVSTAAPSEVRDVDLDQPDYGYHFAPPPAPEDKLHPNLPTNVIGGRPPLGSFTPLKK